MIKGLTQLQPHLPVGAQSQKPFVYLTTNRQLALHYIWDQETVGSNPAVRTKALKATAFGAYLFTFHYSLFTKNAFRALK